MSSACSVCRPQHADGHGDECDHWCHGAGAEDWEALGVAHLVGGCPLEVIKAADEQVVLYEPESGYSFSLSDYGADELRELRELLDRAAMPGQVTVAAFPCCKHCEADNAEYGTSCNPPRHLTRCASGCDDAASPSAGPAPGGEA